MKAAKLSFDLSDRLEIVELLRLLAAQSGKSQKHILIEALEAYFSHQFESRMLLRAAEKSFADWDNPEDDVYNKL